jgi:biotin operon repressor
MRLAPFRGQIAVQSPGVLVAVNFPSSNSHATSPQRVWNGCLYVLCSGGRHGLREDATGGRGFPGDVRQGTSHVQALFVQACGGTVFGRNMNMRDKGLPNDLEPRATAVGRLKVRLREGLIGRCAPGDMMPSERSLASRFQASRVTVQKALDQLRREGWLQRIPRQGYMVARPPRQPLQATGLFFPTDPISLLTLAFFRDVYLGISQAAVENRRPILNFFGANWRFADLNPDAFWSPGVRTLGSLLTLEVFDLDLIQQAAGLYPVVCLDMPCRLPNVSSVCFDHSASIHLAFKYLLDLGHRRIGLIMRRDSEDPADVERHAAFERALRWTDEAPISEPVFDMHKGMASTAVSRWLETDRDRRPTALIVTQAFWQVVQGLTEAKVRIPQDVSVINVATFNLWSDHARDQIARWTVKPTKRLGVIQPPFHNQPAELANIKPTTIHLPAQEMGRQGMLEIVRRCSDPGQEPRHVVLAPALIPGTTAQPHK